MMWLRMSKLPDAICFWVQKRYRWVHQSKSGIESRIIPPCFYLSLFIGDYRAAVALAASTSHSNYYTQRQRIKVDDAGEPRNPPRCPRHTGQPERQLCSSPWCCLRLRPESYPLDCPVPASHPPALCRRWGWT